MIPATKFLSTALVLAASLFIVTLPACAQISIPFDFNFSGGSAAPDRPGPEPVPPPAGLPSLHEPADGPKHAVPAAGTRKRHRHGLKGYTLRGL